MLISCRATRMLLESVESLGADPERLVAGTHLLLDLLRDERRWITWQEFVLVLDRVARLFPEPSMQERIGVGFARIPSFRRVNRLGAWLATPRQAYWLFCRFVGPALFSGMIVNIGEHPDGRIVLSLELPPEVESSEVFFRISKGSIASMPRILGLSDADVDATIGPRRAEYLIRSPEFPPLWRRLRRSFSAFGMTDYALTELERYRQELHDSYDALLRSRRNFRGLLERMSDSVCVHREGRVVWGNAEFLRQLGRERIDDVVGMSILDDIVHPDDRAALAASMRQPNPEAGAIRFRVLRADGEVLTIEISTPQTVEFDGEPARLVVGRDITARQRQEGAMIAADRLASIGVLAAGVAHEINNPLAYVHANLVVAERSLDGCPPMVAEAIAAARDGTDRVRAIVRDLKTLSRGDGDHRELVDVRATVESALTLARKSVEARARLLLALEPVPPVLADRGRLGQVVLNLLLNAADAFDGADPSRHEIAVSTASTTEGVVLAVRDTGSGIAPADLERIFEPFFTTKGPSQGTGLGLSICHRIVTGLGGRIDVESAEGRGTTFRVVLPAATELQTASASPPSPRAPRRAKVLVIDDEPRLLSVLANVLADHHEVVTSTSAEAGLSILRTDDAFDVVLCDLMMAGMSGMDLHETLRAERPGFERRMVFMTGGTFTPRARDFLADSAIVCLEKPFEVDRLLDAVQERLR